MGRQRHLAVITIMLGIALSVLDTTTIALGLPTMTRDLGVSADLSIWIVNGCQLAALVALLPVANWGERISFRRVYLVGAALWGLASAVVVDPGAGADLMPAGTLHWNGAATTSFLADPKNGVVAVLFAQHLPFDERRVIERFRTAVYQALR